VYAIANVTAVVPLLPSTCVGVFAVIVTWSSGAADAGGVGMPRTTIAAATIVPTTRSERDVLRVISKIPPSGNARPVLAGTSVHRMSLRRGISAGDVEKSMRSVREKYLPDIG